MLEVQICVGSSCHLKGAYQVVQIFKEMVKTYDLEDRIHLKASFCQKNCAKGVTVKIGDKLISRVSPENAREIFRRELLKEGEF
ncbi:NADH dehydrogenase [Anoxybacter fermentans]|uniref:NADH dehydrogenase n=1 Tax=Anoxybacter fermentans TaxID=1323375 RepID=A0A3Q9HRL6_9FIRM|nr:(2Fe-2S) ferredoxin domain-containing protein [Anoxybacter fermentans]AZR74160.1 NADH dehydrogenase [Anoxybacter fermentans]